MRTVKEIQGTIAQKQSELAAIFEKAKKADGSGLDMTQTQVEDVRARNTELTDLGRELDEAKLVDETWQKNQDYIRSQNQAATNLNLGGAKGGQGGQQQGQQGQQKTLGELFTEHDAYKNRRSAKSIEVQISNYDYMAAKAQQRKTLMETGAGFAPQAIRTGRVVEYAHRRLMVADLIPQTPTEQSSIVYMEETTSTNGAATRAEGGAAGESALAYTERTEPIREIATWLPVTEIQIEDVDQTRSLIDNRLLFFLDLTEEDQLLSGDGNSPNLTGFHTKSGVQTQAKGSDSVPDAIYKGITKVRATGQAEPTGIIIHPNDWQDIRLLKTTDGIYIWGNPSEPGPERVWGLPGVITTGEPENTGLLGDFELWCEIFRRRGANVKVSDSHSDYFIKGKLAIRADKRLGLVIYRAAAFCKVTGI